MYPHEVQPGDIWLSNCSSERVFEYVVYFSGQHPNDHIWADVPHDMSVMIIGEHRGGPSQQKLMAWDWWGIYRRTSP